MLVQTVLKKWLDWSNTNQCESLHSQVFRCVPKHTVWSRNFTGLCHSVTHSASLGAGESLLRTVEELGLPVTQSDPFYLHMKKLGLDIQISRKTQVHSQVQKPSVHAPQAKE